MMMKVQKSFVKVAAVLGCLAVSCGAVKAEQIKADSPKETNRFYASGAIGVTNLINSSARIDFANVSMPVNYSLQPAFNWALAGGYQYNHFRIEGEFQQFYARSSVATVGRIDAQVSNSMAVNAGFVNAYYLWWFTENIKGFIGGGIGFAGVQSPTLTLTRGCRCSLQSEGSGFAWQLRIGLEYNLTDDARLFVQYSRVGLPSASGSASVPTLDYSNTQLSTAMFGLRWAF